MTKIEITGQILKQDHGDCHYDWQWDLFEDGDKTFDDILEEICEDKREQKVKITVETIEE